MGGAASKWRKNQDGQWTLNLEGKEAGCTDCGVSVDNLEWGVAFFVSEWTFTRTEPARGYPPVSTTYKYTDPLTKENSCFAFGHNSFQTTSITVSQNASFNVNVGHKGGVPEAIANLGAGGGIVIMKYFHIFITFDEIFFQSRWLRANPGGSANGETFLET